MLARDYIYILFELIEAQGFSPIEICDELELDMSSQENCSIYQLHKLVRYIEDNLGIAHSGFLSGLKANTTSHGLMGYAVKTSRNIHEAIQVDEEFIATRVGGVDFSLKILNDTATLDVSLDDAWLKEEQFIFEFIAGAMYSFYLEILPQNFSEISISAIYQRPDTWNKYDKLTDMTWNFGQEKYAISLPTKKLTSKLPTADVALKSLLMHQVKQKLEELKVSKPLDEQVADILSKNLADMPSIKQVASLLGLHKRTLKRRLQSLDTSYRNIVTNLRVERAKRLLRESNYRIDDIAYAVGYSSPTTFQRLFKKWTGVTPSAVR